MRRRQEENPKTELEDLRRQITGLQTQLDRLENLRGPRGGPDFRTLVGRLNYLRDQIGIVDVAEENLRRQLLTLRDLQNRLRNDVLAYERRELQNQRREERILRRDRNRNRLPSEQEIEVEDSEMEIEEPVEPARQEDEDESEQVQPGDVEIVDDLEDESPRRGGGVQPQRGYRRREIVLQNPDYDRNKAATRKNVRKGRRSGPVINPDLGIQRRPGAGRWRGPNIIPPEEQQVQIEIEEPPGREIEDLRIVRRRPRREESDEEEETQDEAEVQVEEPQQRRRGRGRPRGRGRGDGLWRGGRNINIRPNLRYPGTRKAYKKGKRTSGLVYDPFIGIIRRPRRPGQPAEDPVALAELPVIQGPGLRGIQCRVIGIGEAPFGQGTKRIEESGQIDHLYFAQAFDQGAITEEAADQFCTLNSLRFQIQEGDNDLEVFNNRTYTDLENLVGAAIPDAGNPIIALLSQWQTEIDASQIIFPTMEDADTGYLEFIGTSDYILDSLSLISSIIWREHGVMELLADFYQGPKNTAQLAEFKRFLIRREQGKFNPDILGGTPPGPLNADNDFNLFYFAWGSIGQVEEVQATFAWIQNQPIWQQFVMNYRQQNGLVVECRFDPSEYFWWLTNYFNQEDVYFDPRASLVESQSTTYYLERIRGILACRQSPHPETNVFDWARVFKVDLLFSTRFITLLCYIVERVVHPVEIAVGIPSERLVGMACCGGYGIIQQLIQGEDGNLVIINDSLQLQGIPTVQILLLIMEQINTPFSQFRVVNDDPHFFNRQTSQIFTKISVLNFNNVPDKSNLYNTVQQNNDRGQRNILRAMKPLRPRPQEFENVMGQALTTQIGRFAVQTRLRDGQFEAFDIVDPENFRKVAAVISVVIRRLLERDETARMIAAGYANMWLRIDMNIIYEIILGALRFDYNATTLHEDHFIGGSFRVGPAMVEEFQDPNIEVANATSRLLLAMILQLDVTQDLRARLGIPESNADYLEAKRDIQIDEAENQEFYESGVSLDELLKVYRDNLIQHGERGAQAARRRDEQLLDYHRDRPRRNQRQLDSIVNDDEIATDFTATIQSCAVVFYVREGDWWGMRQKIIGESRGARRYTIENGWDRISRLNWNREGRMSIHLRVYQCEMWSLIESVFFKYSCAQHLAIYLLYLSAIIQKEDIIDLRRSISTHDMQTIRTFLEEWPQFQNLSDDPLSVVGIINQIRGFVSPVEETEEIELEVEYPNERIVRLGKVRVRREMATLRVFFCSGHIIPVVAPGVFRQIRILQKSDLSVHFPNQFDIKEKKSFQTPAAIPQGKMKQENLLEGDVYENFVLERDLHRFYKKNFKPIGVAGKDQFFCWLDIETTTQMKVAVGEKHKMTPYIIACRFMSTQPSVSSDGRKDSFGGVISDGDSWLYDGENCISLFLNRLKNLIFRIVREGKEKRKLIVSAWNGRKFDFQFFIERLYRMFPNETELVGTMTNPKHLKIAGVVEFWDAMDMVGPMSLARFCKSMGEPGKFDGSLMFKINQMVDWYRMKNEDRESANKLLEYCMQDVDCMMRSMRKFNKMILGCIGLIQSENLEIKEKDIWCLEKTMAKLSFTIFTKYVIPPSCAPKPLATQEQFSAMTDCYRGGFVLSFIFGAIDTRTNLKVRHLNYIDINSLYPSVMAESRIPVEFCVARLKFLDRFTVLKARSIYEIVSFDCGEEDHFGFFGVRVFNERGHFTKVIYPTSWKGHEHQQSLWVFGSEILLFRKVFKKGKIQIRHYFQCIKNKRLFRPIKLLYDKRCEFKVQNPPLAESLKLLMNSCYGRFGMKAYEVSAFVHETQLENLSGPEQDELLMNLLDQRKKGVKQGILEDKCQGFQAIQSIRTFNNDSLLKLIYRREGDYMPTNEVQRLKHVAAWIATQARCRLLSTIYQIKRETKLEVIYCDTDSVVYGGQSQVEMDQIKKLVPWSWNTESLEYDGSFQSAVLFNNDLGSMKEEVDADEEMIIFQGFGPKFYRYAKCKKADPEKTLKWVHKSKGINQNLRSISDEALNEKMNVCRQMLFFEEFQKTLSSEIYQQQFRSKKGEMFVERNVKRNSFQLTRKLIKDGGSNMLAQTRPFKDLEEYNLYSTTKKPILFNNHYIYQDL